MIVAAERPRTIGSLREDHLGLMREWRALPDDETRYARAEAFRRVARDAGRDIASERDEAQGIIDYWASAVAGLSKRTYPEILTLAPYSGDAARRAGGSAMRVFEALGSEEEKRAARQLFEDLLYRGANGIERGAPRTRAVLRQRIGSASLDAVLGRFEETGAITRLPGDTRENDRFEATDGRLVEDWPDLRQWIEALAEYNEMLARMMAQAERWRAADRDPLLLARSKEVGMLDRFRGETDLLDTFIDESKRGRRRFAIIRNAVVVLAVILLAGAALYFKREKEAVKAELVAATAAKVAATNEKNAATKAKNEAIEDEKIALDVADATSSAQNLPPPATGTSSRVEALPGVSGALWLGSVERPQVGPVRKGEAFTRLDRANRGTAYRVRADIVLREAMPDRVGPYVSKPKKAVIPAGSLVVVQGPPQSYVRPTGRQYWANVRVVPRVYIQYANGERAAIEPLRTRLAAIGFDLPPAEPTKSAAGLSEVRYFNALDRVAAAELVTALRDSDVAAARAARCEPFVNSRLKTENFIIELWLDLKRDRSARRTPDC